MERKRDEMDNLDRVGQTVVADSCSDLLDLFEIFS